MLSSIHYSCSLNSGPHTSKDCQLAAKLCWFCDVPTWDLGILKPGHHSRKTSTHIHGIHSASCLIRSHLTKYTIIFTSVVLSWIRFGTNKQEKMRSASPVKRDLETTLDVPTCIFINFPICFPCLIPHHLLCKGPELDNETFTVKGIFEAFASSPIQSSLLTQM